MFTILCFLILLLTLTAVALTMASPQPRPIAATYVSGIWHDNRVYTRPSHFL